MGYTRIVKAKRRDLMNVRFRDTAARAIRDIMNGVLLSDKDTFTQSCITCVHFAEATEQCAKYQARPPARTIAFGCDAYDDIDDEIPF